MTWRERIEAMWELIVRLPPLYVMDSILNKSFFPEFSLFQYQPSMSWAEYFLWILIMTLLFVLALCVFLLTTGQLQDIYSLVTLLSLLYMSYQWNQNFPVPLDIKHSSDVKHNYYDIMQNAVTQIFLSYTFTYIWTLRKRTLPRNGIRALISLGIMSSFMFPSIVCVVSQDIGYLYWVTLISIVIPSSVLFAEVWICVRAVVWTLRRIYNVIKITISAIGIQGFVEHHWIRLRVPKVLRLFWISRLFYHFTMLCLEELYQREATLISVHSLDYQSIIIKLFTQSCENFVAMLGMTSIVSFLAHHVGVFLAFCVGSDSEEDRNMGTVSAILFFILGLQTGLTGLTPDIRLARLCKNFCLLLTAISHFIHSMIHPILMSLSASQSSHVVRHLRVLSMCIFLLTFPTCLLMYLWSHYSVSTWLLAVTAFSVEVMLKVIVSLTVYALFLLDAYRNTFWEGLDDYVYYIQSAGNTIEFLFGIFLFCNGAWIMVFESGGAIRAIMMCIHAYCNIWVQAKNGWQVFTKRRTAVNKINSLPLASKSELETLNDVCAICYHELNNARITRCNHYFHGVCLRKWLYVQDNCPLCHKLIYAPDSVTSETQENNNQEDDFEELDPGVAAPNGFQDGFQQPLNPVLIGRQDVGRQLNNGTFQPANTLRVQQD
ncbi:protein TRC8 homolog [Saccostrea cucullata]|uniref:protein TRC8 homolog n=1 Tax=Saccostrea cuccullata TaxID=36930 RepID=UPI002ED01A59